MVPTPSMVVCFITTMSAGTRPEASGEWGDTSGAKMATSTMSARTTREIFEEMGRARRPSKRSPGVCSFLRDSADSIRCS